MPHKWAYWLRQPCRLKGPQRFRMGGKITSGPQMGGLATSPLASRGSPTAHCWGQNQERTTSGRIGYITVALSGVPHNSGPGRKQNWPSSGRIGYATPAVLGVPDAYDHGRKSKVAHKWEDCLHNPFVAHVVLGSPTLCGRQNRKWPTSGHIGYITPAVSVVPQRLRRGTPSVVGYDWVVDELHNPYKLVGSKQFTTQENIGSGP